MSSEPILDRLMRRHPRVITLDFGRLTRLLDRMGNPEKRLPPVVHVAGTNGKGSLCAYVRSMTEAAGYRVHVFTSPHLVRFNERFRLGAFLMILGQRAAPRIEHRGADAAVVGGVHLLKDAFRVSDDT